MCSVHLPKFKVANVSTLPALWQNQHSFGGVNTKAVIDLFDDNHFMKEALKEAIAAFEDDEVPVGAVVVCNNRIIARAHNLTERLTDVTAHAEMQAITSASNFLGAKYLQDCPLYVTLEPCAMCAGALFWSQMGKVVFGAADEKRGFTTMGGQLHPKTEIVSGVMANDCSDLMVEFFRKKR
jgi:tRNA(adenine34) deaminase